MIRKTLVEHETGYRPGSLISDTVSLGYGSLPLTVTVSVETHLQSKSFLSSLLQVGTPIPSTLQVIHLERVNG